MSSPSSATKPRRSPCSATVLADIGDVHVPYETTVATRSKHSSARQDDARARPPLPRHLCAGIPCFRQADRDRLLAARHASARAAALQGAALALAHRALDLLPSFLAVFSHAHPPYRSVPYA